MNLIAGTAKQELEMCCETLCTKQVVQNYITYLENRIKELENGTERQTDSLETGNQWQTHFDWYGETEDEFDEQVKT